jgi:methylenetetrahydrofolate dehydrogenase (NADP+)/methenyltetrahydrofolate cyclohydrolase
MAAMLIDGKVVSEHILNNLKPRIEALKARGITPGLAAVLVGDDPASATYVNGKAKACQKLGLYSEVITRPANITQADLLTIVHDLNRNDRIHGILVQSPLPPQLDELGVTVSIDPKKDVDGFHPYNVGMLLLGRPTLISCTPHGIIKLLEYYQIETSGRDVVVIGRSNIVGRGSADAKGQRRQRYGNDCAFPVARSSGYHATGRHRYRRHWPTEHRDCRHDQGWCGGDRCRHQPGERPVHGQGVSTGGRCRF